MLPNREAETVKTWLEAHPEIEYVSRDRAGAYAVGAAKGAPQATQIADRWHVAKNLGDAVEDFIKRKRIRIPDVEPTDQSEGSSVESAPTPAGQTRMSHLDERYKDQRQQLWEQAQLLHEQGYGVRTIGKLLGLARNTVRRYLKMEEGWSAAPRPKRRSLLDPHRDYLLTRWTAGEHNGNQLTREIRSQGYQGCDTLVREVTTRLRKTYPDVASLPRTPASAQPTAPLPPLVS